MNREDLFRLCAVLAGLGLVMIYAADRYTELPSKEISEIDRGDVGKNLRVNGTARDVEVSGQTEFFRLSDGNSSIQAVSFSQVGLEERDRVSVRGHITLYHGELELVAESVQK